MHIDDLDGNLELASSDSSTTLDDAASATQVTDTAADGANSSDAQGEPGESDLLSVVRDVVDKSRQPQAETASPAEGAEAGETADDASKTPDDENFSDVPFNKHPRFQQLVKQRNAYKLNADRYDNVQSFIDQQGLSPEEVADGLIIMGLCKTNPQAGWARLRPFVENVLVAAGELLPPEIQQRVQQGELTQAAALELSRAVAGQKALENRFSFEQQMQQRRQQMQSVQAVQQSAADWEADRQTKDPNYAAKIEPLRREVAFLQHTEGRPNTPEGVRDQLNRAYAAVNKSLPPRVPTPAPVGQRRAVTPVVGGQTGGNARPEPKSTLDIIRAARA